MKEFSDVLKANFDADFSEQFQKRACYYPKVDFIEYLSVDAITVSERIDTFLTLIWDDNHVELVGFRLKGFRYVYDEVLKPLKNIKEDAFDLIMEAVEHIYTQIGNDAFQSPKDDEKKTDAYKNVIAFIKKEEVSFDEQELEEAA